MFWISIQHIYLKKKKTTKIQNSENLHQTIGIVQFLLTPNQQMIIRLQKVNVVYKILAFFNNNNNSNNNK